MTAAPAKMTQGAAAPLTSVATMTTTSAPVRRNLGHHRVRRIRTRRAPLRRAGLPGGAAGRPTAPGTGATGPSLSRCRGRTVITSPLMHRVIRKDTNGCKPYVNEMQNLWRLCGEEADGSLPSIRQPEVGLGGLKLPPSPGIKRRPLASDM